jgi:hypothetical protein
MYRLSKSVTALEEQRVRFQTYKRDHEELRQALQDEQIWVHKKANGFGVERTKDKKKHLSQEAQDSPLKSLAAAEASIASKDAQLIEIKIELDPRKTSIEDLEHKHLKLEQELERVLLLLDDAGKHRAKSVHQTTNLELQLAQASLFVRDVKADERSFKSEGLQQLTHSNKLEKMELRKADDDLFGSGKR